MKRLLAAALACLALAGCAVPESLVTVVVASASPALQTAIATLAHPAITASPTLPRPTATPEPTTTPTPVVLGGPPQLVSPPDGETIGRGTLLSWVADRPLGEDEYYVLVITFTHGTETWHDGAWLTGTSWAVPNYFGLPHSSDGWYEWKVVVMKQTGVDDDGKPVGFALSVDSETRRFLCYGD